MHKKKVVFSNCLCGNLNEVRIVSTIHNRQQVCPRCYEWNLKSANSLFLMNKEFDVFQFSISSFESFAIAWG